MDTLKYLLHGEWLGYPLHPLLVHLPTGLWPAALVFDLLSRIGTGDNALVQAAFYAILFGLLSAALAVPCGLADWSEIGPDKPARKVGLYHLILNLTGAAVWLTNLCLRFRDLETTPATPALPLLLSVIGTLLLLVGAYLGGRMTYGYGTFVGWMGRERWRRRAEAGGARLPPE